MTIPVTTTNTANEDTSRDEELARFAQELFRNEAEVELAKNTSTEGSGDNQTNGLSVNTAVPISGPEYSAINATTTTPPLIDQLTPPQPQQMERYVPDNSLLVRCDDCRVHAWCCSLTQFSVLMYGLVIAGMGIGIRLFNVHFGFTTFGLMVTSGAVFIIWIAYLIYFLRLA